MEWEEHTEFEKAINKINRFAQSDIIHEDEVDYIQSYFENNEFEAVKSRLKYMLNEVEPLYESIKFAYNYIEKINS